MALSRTAEITQYLAQPSGIAAEAYIAEHDTVAYFRQDSILHAFDSPGNSEEFADAIPDSLK